MGPVSMIRHELQGVKTAFETGPGTNISIGDPTTHRALMASASPRRTAKKTEAVASNQTLCPHSSLSFTFVPPVFSAKCQFNILSPPLFLFCSFFHYLPPPHTHFLFLKEHRLAWLAGFQFQRLGTLGLYDSTFCPLSSHPQLLVPVMSPAYLLFCSYVSQLGLEIAVPVPLCISQEAFFIRHPYLMHFPFYPYVR